MIKNCERCNEELGDVNPRKLYCTECKRLVNIENSKINSKLQRQRQRIIRDIKAHQAANKSTKTLDEWCREAAECNLDYGTYRTLVELHGKTFDELKDQAQYRHTSAHAHGHHTRSIRDD